MCFYSHFFLRIYLLSPPPKNKWWPLRGLKILWCLPVKLQRVHTHHPSQHHTAKHAHHSQTHDEGGWQCACPAASGLKSTRDGTVCVSKNVPSRDWQSRLPSRDNNKSPITSLPGSQFHHPPLSNCHRPTSQSPVSIPSFSSIFRQLSSSERLTRSFFTNCLWLAG